MRQLKDVALRHDWTEKLKFRISATHRVCHGKFLYFLLEGAIIQKDVFLIVQWTNKRLLCFEGKPA